MSDSRVSDAKVVPRVPTPEMDRAGEREDLACFNAKAGNENTRRRVWLAMYDAAPEPQAELHPRTADLVQRFSAAVAEKLAAAEKKYGYSDNWARDGWMDECRAHLAEHVRKGDPRDVAAYCAFLWHHGESTSAHEPQAEPAESADTRAAHQLWCEGVIATQRFASDLPQTHLACDSAELLAYVNARRPAEKAEPPAYDDCDWQPEPQAEPATDGEVERVAENVRTACELFAMPEPAVEKELEEAAALLRQQAQRIAELEAQLAVEPSGYHYVYSDPLSGNDVVVRSSNGGRWNGQHPKLTIPYYYAPPDLSRRNSELEAQLAAVGSGMFPGGRE